jgi:hypothetical protein
VGGGGGGAGAVGGNGVCGGGYGTPGNGGNGSADSITGVSVTRAGGGGGATYNTTGGGTGGTGGGGGGGARGQGTSGSANTGGGGGGANGTQLTPPFPYYAGGNGGSGIVILAYTSSVRAIDFIDAGLTYTVDTTTRSGYRVYSFTAGTGRIAWYSGTAPSPTRTQTPTPTPTPSTSPCTQTCYTTLMAGDSYGDYNFSYTVCLNGTTASYSGNCGSANCIVGYYCMRNGTLTVNSGNNLGTSGICCSN